MLHHDAHEVDAMIQQMRTTVTLDEDVESLIAAAMRERGISFKQAVNEAIRAGLAPRSAATFRQRSFSMGFRPEINYDRIDTVRGMDITICTTARTDDEARALLRAFGFPFRTGETTPGLIEPQKSRRPARRGRK